MNYTQLNAVISDAVVYGGDLNEIKRNWVKHVNKLDRFFDMYLERYGNKLTDENTNTPEWRLYKTKSNEYHDYTRAINNVSYYIAKANVSKL